MATKRKKAGQRNLLTFFFVDFCVPVGTLAFLCCGFPRIFGGIAALGIITLAAAYFWFGKSKFKNFVAEQKCVRVSAIVLFPILIFLGSIFLKDFEGEYRWIMTFGATVVFSLFSLMTIFSRICYPGIVILSAPLAVPLYLFQNRASSGIGPHNTNAEELNSDINRKRIPNTNPKPHRNGQESLINPGSHLPVTIIGAESGVDALINELLSNQNDPRQQQDRVKKVLEEYKLRWREIDSYIDTYKVHFDAERELPWMPYAEKPKRLFEKDLATIAQILCMTIRFSDGQIRQDGYYLNSDVNAYLVSSILDGTCCTVCIHQKRTYTIHEDIPIFPLHYGCRCSRLPLSLKFNPAHAHQFETVRAEDLALNRVRPRIQ
jgi:hypothetical protein